MITYEHLTDEELAQMESKHLMLERAEIREREILAETEERHRNQAIEMIRLSVHFTFHQDRDGPVTICDPMDVHDVERAFKSFYGYGCYIRKEKMNASHLNGGAVERNDDCGYGGEQEKSDVATLSVLGH